MHDLSQRCGHHCPISRCYILMYCWMVRGFVRFYLQDEHGVPFDCSHVYASGNLAADMYAHVAAESTGRMLAVSLFNITDDPGRKNMLSYMIARDTMHQNQWMAVIEEIGGNQVHTPSCRPRATRAKSHPRVVGAKGSRKMGAASSLSQNNRGHHFRIWGRPCPKRVCRQSSDRMAKSVN